MINTTCPNCQRQFKLPESAAEQRITCTCGTVGKIIRGCFVQFRRGKPVVAKGKAKG